MEKRLITDLDINLVEASKSVLLEIMTVLGAYRKSLVLVGGWAPYFIVEAFKPPSDAFLHAGSLDIDIAVNPKKVSEVEYKSMLRLIKEHGYINSLNKEGKVIPYAFEKFISIPGYKDKQPIEIDFLGPEYGGRGKQNAIPYLYLNNTLPFSYRLLTWFIVNPVVFIIIAIGKNS